jgi:hypothetical protein
MKTCTVTAQEIKETKIKLESGVVFENESANYQILFRRDGGRVFFVAGQYRWFKDDSAFVRATVRIVKRGW